MPKCFWKNVNMLLRKNFIADNIKISSDDFYNEHSDEESSDEENLIQKICFRKMYYIY